ncbi:cadherin-like domain-containing protein, partial [Synechococcus sp. Nb3U1]|uniref:Ig-like domain-containing protein n=1 Tax=Synechococcus sp. Nb3U1 TaxID=1914529 RepID=UPI001F438FAE
TPPSNGTVSVNPLTGEITYTPNPSFTGTDTFVYEVCDNGSTPLCDTATVTVTVESVGPTPSPTPDLGTGGIRLVKRITAINGSPIPGYVNLPEDPNDEPGIPWPGGAESFLQGSISQAVQSGLGVEFSIYFLLNSPSAALSVCDPHSAGV